MSSNGPYFIDPELSHSSAPDAQMYALADGAMQAHQEQHQLAGLVQAATAAADHEGHDGRQGHDPELGSASTPRATLKRQRGQNEDEDKELESGQDGHHQKESPAVSSASALFRRPSKAAKKYTRPPMSKLFASLELAPENFLQLQSAAKNYMLDPAYPDRQDTVGQRGKGDSELVKLRLWNCVKDFLENQGVGLQYFSPDVPGDEGQQRTMIWPRDKNGIISAITPLLRRMVTNERQRQYAVETRKNGASNSAFSSSLIRQSNGSLAEIAAVDHSDGSEKSLFELATGAKPSEYVVGETYDWPMLKPHLVIVIEQTGLPDKDLRQVVASISYHLRYTHRAGFMIHSTVCSGPCPGQFLDVMVRTGRLDKGSWKQPVGTFKEKKRDSMKVILREIFDIIQAVIAVAPQMDGPPPVEGPSHIGETSSPADAVKPEADGYEHALVLQVSIVQNGKRIIPRRDIHAPTVPYLHSILQDAMSQVGPIDLGQTPKVKVLCPEGLVAVEDDAAWQRIMKLAKQTIWMDGEMKVILEIQ